MPEDVCGGGRGLDGHLGVFAGQHGDLAGCGLVGVVTVTVTVAVTSTVAGMQA